MARKIVADSSADLLAIPGVDFVSVPLCIDAGQNHWVDDAALDTGAMLDALAVHKGKSCSACPSPDDYLTAFGDAEEIFVVPISRGMSGSYNSACVAARDYQEAHPDRKVHVIDTLSAGAGMTLIIDQLQDLMGQGFSFEEIADMIEARCRKIHLLFCLRSVRTLASNGRMPMTVAAIIGMLNIRMIGYADENGKGIMLDKTRGDKKMLAAMVNQLKEKNFNGGRYIIHHCRNLELAEELKRLVLAEWPDADVVMGETRGLCSYYAEDGGIMTGFEEM